MRRFFDRPYFFGTRMIENDVIQWLLQGDVSVQYQVQCDLLNADKAARLKGVETFCG